MQLSLYLVAMERAGAPLLSFGPPPRAPHPCQWSSTSLAKRLRPPEEAEQVSAIPIVPHGPWPRPHHSQQLCWSPTWGTASCEPHGTHNRRAPSIRPSIGHALWQSHSPWRRPRRLGGATRDREAPIGTNLSHHQIRIIPKNRHFTSHHSLTSLDAPKREYLKPHPHDRRTTTNQELTPD